MKLRAAIHLDLAKNSRFSTALGNLENFLAQIPAAEADLRVVANSTAVGFFRKEKASDYRGRVDRLAESGVRFLICRNSLERLGIEKSELIEAAEIVPSGIVEVIRLQNDGFAYVKP